MVVNDIKSTWIKTEDGFYISGEHMKHWDWAGIYASFFKTSKINDLYF